MTSDVEVVVTLAAGQSPTPVRAFRRGETVAPFGVGASAAWRVTADGVLPTHLFLAFDGEAVFASAATPDVEVWLAGQRIGHEWTRVPGPSELRFGAAMFSVMPGAAPGIEPPTSSTEHTVHDGGALFAAAQRAMVGIAPLKAPEPAPWPSPEVNPAYRGPPAAGRPPVLAPVLDAPSPPGGQDHAAPAPETTEVLTRKPNFWQQASPAKKASLLLLPVVAIALAFLPTGDGDGDGDGTAPAAATSARRSPAVASAGAAPGASGAPVPGASGAPVPGASGAPVPGASGAPVPGASGPGTAADPAVGAGATEPPAAVPDLPVPDPGARAEPEPPPSRRGEPARPTRDTKDTRTPERIALDAVSKGSYAEAARLYDDLAKAHPEDPTYREAARILRERLARRQ